MKLDIDYLFFLISRMDLSLFEFSKRPGVEGAFRILKEQYPVEEEIVTGMAKTGVELNSQENRRSIWKD